MRFLPRVLSMLALLGLAGLSAPGTVVQGASGLSKINHIIVIVQENWSFDSLYGKFPGVNGLANAAPPCSR